MSDCKHNYGARNSRGEWVDRHNCSHVIWRESLIARAVEYANKQAGPKLVRCEDDARESAEYTAKWDRLFHEAMRMLTSPKVRL